MIEKIVIENNFKSIEKVELHCKKINIFIGPSGSGKSNILEAIGILSLNLSKELLRIEKDEELFYMYDISRDIALKVTTETLKTFR